MCILIWFLYSYIVVKMCILYTLCMDICLSIILHGVPWLLRCSMLRSAVLCPCRVDRTNSDSVIHVAGVGGWVVSRVSTVRLQLVVLCRKKEKVRWNVRSTLIERDSLSRVQDMIGTVPLSNTQFREGYGHSKASNWWSSH